MGDVGAVSFEVPNQPVMEASYPGGGFDSIGGDPRWLNPMYPEQQWYQVQDSCKNTVRVIIILCPMTKALTNNFV